MEETQFAVWKREDSNTAPRGFGFMPAYSIDKPYTSECEMIWAEPIMCTLPEGYTIAESNGGTKELYDNNGRRVAIIDYHGHPSVVLGIKRDKRGNTIVIHKQLDN